MEVIVSNRIFNFSKLSEADLIVDALYEGGCSGNAGDDPISKLLKCGNQGGFRYLGGYSDARYCVLYSELSNTDWPEEIDFERGIFIYFGDNKKPGHELHDTPKKGNQILRNVFDRLHSNDLKKVPPFFIFTKGGSGRSVIFRGLAVPGAVNLAQTDDLVAVWKNGNSQRFQNYKATFTILNESLITRKWLDTLIKGSEDPAFAPEALKKWRLNKKYDPLLAPPTVLHRSQAEQVPQNDIDKKFITTIKEYFSTHLLGEYAFEKCAVAIAQMMDDGIISCDNTRPWRDGGRDAVGIYRIGNSTAYTDVEFALEAKCYKLSNDCGVKETSRLISRLRHRQFGIFITTSYVSLQAYKEIIEDRHPVLIVSAIDIVKILQSKGISTNDSLISWLKQF